MLDNLSRGRIITGFVRGIGNEYHSTGINPFHSHERYQEAHDLIVQAWTKPGPFPFEGEHYNFRYVNLWPRPYQTPHPPIWIPSMGSSETIKWAAAPERKYPFLVTFSGRDLVARYLNLYREQARQYGYEASPDQIGWATPVYVADTDERARAEAKAGMMFAPAATPKPVVALLEAELKAIIADPALARRFADIGFDATPMTAEQVAATLRQTGEKLVPVIKRLNIKLD